MLLLVSPVVLRFWFETPGVAVGVVVSGGFLFVFLQFFLFHLAAVEVIPSLTLPVFNGAVAAFGFWALRRG